MSRLTSEELRDYLIRAHGMATAHYVQTDTEMRQRIGAMLESAIEADDTMRKILGRDKYPQFYTEMKCSQCGFKKEYIMVNGCPESRGGCGRAPKDQKPIECAAEVLK